MHRIAIALAIGTATAHASAPSRELLPTVYEAGHFYAVPETTSGQNLRLLVDTGGAGGSGWYVIDAKAAARLGLTVSSCALEATHVDVVAPIAFRPGKGLPPSSKTPCDSGALVVKGIGEQGDDDGLLGAGYLPGHVWTFDYPKRQIWLQPTTWKPSSGAHRTALGFPRDDKGKPTAGLPRITLKIDGQPLDLLLDTGATAHPTPAGEHASGTSTTHGRGVTSYITTSVLEGWHRAHPQWRVIADADDLSGSGSRLIEVPRVEIAGWLVGPVWFAERADPNFAGMSHYMDQPIHGAVGGNVFDHFVMTLDYPASAAWFACATQCKFIGK